MLDKNMNSSWLETEMDESVTLLRKKLEEMNEIHPDRLDETDICAIKNIYKALFYICSIKKAIKTSAI